MTYALHKGAMIFGKYGGKEMYLGFLLPTPNVKPAINPRTECVIDIYTNTNLRKLKAEMMKAGKQLSQEDGINFIPAF
jgi:hypothetical protein